jgi:thiol-disulfide isomerase/thioredoxin
MIALGITILSALSPYVMAQAPPAGTTKTTVIQTPKADAATAESINAEFQREVLNLERKRLQQLGRLAASQPKDQAAATYAAFFSIAISNSLYAEAEPVAEALIKSKDTAPSVAWMAHLVNIVAEADKGQFEESLRSLAAAIRLKSKDPQATGESAALSVGTRASILDAYYQKLVREDQFDLARRAMKLIVDNTDVPAIRDLAEGRLKQLDMVGRIAPAIRGIDVDRKPFTLEAGKGEVVLVVFWASWCGPNAQEMPWLETIHSRYSDRGFRIVGVNVDAPPGPAQDTAMPNVRRFLLDFNAPWPNLLNGKGDADLAQAFGVRDIPANVLIGRDGKVSHLDLRGARLERAIANAVKPAK